MVVAHQSGRRTCCGCTPDAAKRVSSRVMVPCDNPAETCDNHFWITSLSPFQLKEEALASGGHDGQGLVSRAGLNIGLFALHVGELGGDTFSLSHIIGPILLSCSDPLPGICSMTPKIC